MDRLMAENPVIIAALALSALSIIGWIILRAQINTLMRLQRVLRELKGSDTNSLLETMEQASATLVIQAERLQDLELRHDALLKKSRGFTQRLAVVRYNAFDNMGADLSFSVAVLDEDNNGFVLTSLYGREDSRVYAKPVLHGDSAYALTDEEKAAIRQTANQN
jgi:hypothetical protein